MNGLVCKLSIVIKIHLSLFSRAQLTIVQCWFRQDRKQATITRAALNAAKSPGALNWWIPIWQITTKVYRMTPPPSVPPHQRPWTPWCLWASRIRNLKRLIHSREADSNAENYCMLFNNPNSHRTVESLVMTFSENGRDLFQANLDSLFYVLWQVSWFMN